MTGAGEASSQHTCHVPAGFGGSGFAPACGSEGLWPSVLDAEDLRDELRGLALWFGIGMASEPLSDVRLRLKRGSRWKVPMLREGGRAHRVAATMMPAAGDEFAAAVVAQSKPVIINGLLASAECKRVLSAAGVGISLGTTGVERGWWATAMRNTSPTSVWGRRSYLQYRVTIAWKEEVRAALRRLRAGTVLRDASHQKLREDFEHRRDGARMPLRCSSVCPVEPDHINQGFDLYRQAMLDPVAP